VGVDPAAASIEVAKSNDPTARITWVHGDATAVPALGVDLAVMTGNVAQVFLSNDSWTQTLRGIHEALRPHGHLVFETRRPERRAWADWAADTDPIILDIPGTGPVESTLVAQGYRVLDIREAPDRPGREFVFIAERTT
jgi:SAM-dependent methyltransferase